MKRGWRPSFIMALLGTPSCGGETWLDAPAGPLAGEISAIAWVFGGLSAAVWIVTLGFVAYAVARGRRRDAAATDDATTRTQRRAVGAAAALSLLLLLSLAIADFLVLRDAEPELEPTDLARAAETRLAAEISSAPIVGTVPTAEASLGSSAQSGVTAGDAARLASPLTIDVAAHQWWWELTYSPDDPEARFTTANEIHIPVGRPVLLRLRSSDVIHSFWVPRLNGKRDLIPGYRNALWIQADEPGVYRGACAEFCGVQHARMKIVVVADPPEHFEAWYAQQLASAAPPATPLALEGRRVFVEGPCALCHTIRGTRARGRVGPDLTHLAARRTIAAGVLPNTRGHLAGWIVNPQQLKPGVHMPPNPLPAADLQALLHYLESLR